MINHTPLAIKRIAVMLLLTIGLPYSLLAQGDLRTFHNQNGQAIKARIVCVSGDSVSIERDDGKTFTAKIDGFSSSDQSYIKHWSFAGPEHQEAPLIVLNYLDGETLPYPLAVIKGRSKADVDTISLELNGERLTFPVHQHRFNSIVMLKEGRNQLNYLLPDSEHPFELTYTPGNNPRKLRVVYAYFKDSEGQYWDVATGTTGSKAAMKKKIELSLYMYQTSLAELMNESGYGRMTVEFMPAEDGSLVHEFVIDKSIKEFAADPKMRMRLFSEQYPFDESIQNAYVANYVSHYKTGRNIHPGMFNASRRCINLVSKFWSSNPTNLHELNWALVDETFRGPRAIPQSITGLWLHEGGHAMYGQHTMNEGIMNSGCRWIFNQFLLLNPYKFRDTGETALVNSHDKQPVIQPPTAFAFSLNPFLNTNIADKDILPRASNRGSVTLNETKDSFIIESERGIRSVEFYEYTFQRPDTKSVVMTPHTFVYPEGITTPSAKDKLPRKVVINKAEVIANLFEIPDLRNVPKIRVLDGHFAHGRHWLKREDHRHDESLLKLRDSNRFTVQSRKKK